MKLAESVIDEFNVEEAVANPMKNELYGDPKKLTSSRIIGVGEGKFQVEAGIGRQGFSVRLDNSKMAKFIGDMFYRASKHIGD